MTGTGSSDVGAFGPNPRAPLEALSYTSKTIRTSRSKSTALHVRCPATYHQSHCSCPLVRWREAESAVSKDLIELPSTGSKWRTYATVQTYHTCDCRDNPHQPMAPRRRGSRVPFLRSVLMQPTLIREYLLFLAVRELSLRDASPGDLSQPPFSDRFLGRRPSLTLFQRGTASDNTLRWTFIQDLSAKSPGVTNDRIVLQLAR